MNMLDLFWVGVMFDAISQAFFFWTIEIASMAIEIFAANS